MHRALRLAESRPESDRAVGRRAGARDTARVLVVWVGLRMAGRVLDTGEYHVETRCAHLMGLPLAPLRSYLVVDRESGAAVELPELQRASVVAAYGRAWGPALALAGLASLLLGAGGWPLAGIYLAAGLATTAIGWRAGSVGDDDRARYAVYGRHLGRALEPALLAAAEQRSLRDALHAAVVDAAVVYVGRGYRDAGASPRDAWELVLLGPEVTDVALLERGLTLARLEGALAHEPEARRRFRAAHASLWAKLRAHRRAPPGT